MVALLIEKQLKEELEKEKSFKIVMAVGVNLAEDQMIKLFITNHTFVLE